jgi:serine/threonine protein kinase
MDSAVLQALEGVIISHYQIQQRLAHGGMSDIYLARDTQTEQIVAIKLVDRRNDVHYECIQREVQALRVLTHENVLPVLEYGEHGPWCYMVIPYIEYGTLGKRLTQGPLAVKEAGKVLEQLASVLQFAHNQGMLHRDIKPANILLGNGQQVYLIDFGLVQQQGEKRSLIQTSLLIGTPHYMAPELVEGPATIRSDVYALGVVLYQMLIGSVPFTEDNPLVIFWKHREELLEPPSSLNPAQARAVESVLLQALEKKPQDRFQTARDLAEAYQRALKVGETTPLPEEVRLVRRSPLREFSQYLGLVRHIQRINVLIGYQPKLWL